MSASGTLQEQISELSQTVTDLESSPSGVIAYVDTLTTSEYDKTYARVLSDLNEKVTEISRDLADASGSLLVLKNAIRFHTH